MGHYNTYVNQLLKIILLLLLLIESFTNSFSSLILVSWVSFNLQDFKQYCYNCNVFKLSNAKAKMWKKQANIFHFVYNNSYSFNHPFFTIPGKETVCGNKRRYKKSNNFINTNYWLFQENSIQSLSNFLSKKIHRNRSESLYSQRFYCF